MVQAHARIILSYCSQAKGGSPQFFHHGTPLLKYVRAVFLINEVGEMVLQRFFIATLLLIFEDLNDNR